MLVAVLLGGRGTATAATLLDGDIRALAISGDRVAALRGAEVVLLSTAGRLLGTLDGLWWQLLMVRDSIPGDRTVRAALALDFPLPTISSRL